jgi:Forkhead domain
MAARGEPQPINWEQGANRPNPTFEHGTLLLANPRKALYAHRATEPQEPVQHVHPPPDEVGMSGSTVSGIPLPPLRSPLTSEARMPQRAWSHAHTPSSSSALGLQPGPATSLVNRHTNNPDLNPLLPPMQPQYTRPSEREAAAIEHGAVVGRVSQLHGHTGQLDHLQQRSTQVNDQTLAQIGQLPHYQTQPLPPTGHSYGGINMPNTGSTSRTCINPITSSLRPAVFSSPSPESDPATIKAPPPPPSTSASNLSSQNPSRRVTGDSVSTEMLAEIDPVAGNKRSAEEAFAHDVAFDLGGGGDVDYGDDDVEMIDELADENEIGAETEVEAGEEAGEENENNSLEFIHEDGRPPPPKRRRLNNASNYQNHNIRLPPPPSLAGTSRLPAARTPEVMLTQLDTDPAVPTATASAAPIATTSTSANLPPPVPVFQRDPDAPPSYADWVQENQPDAEVERWMECTRRNLVYDPSAVPAPPEGFESGKDRKTEGGSGEDPSGEKEKEGEEIEGYIEIEKEKEKEGNAEGSAGGSGKSKPYEINELTPPNVNEGLWCLLDYPQSIKPKYSYAFMARVAILGSPTRRLQLQDIYVMIEAKFSFYRDGNHVSWKVCREFGLLSGAMD